MSDPREAVEQAIKNRESVDQYDKKEAYSRQQQEYMNKQSAQTEQAQEETKPETQESTNQANEGSFQNDVQDPGTRQQVEQQNQVTEANQAQTRERSTNRAKKMVQQGKEILDRAETWYQENVSRKAEATAQTRYQAAVSAKKEGRNLEAGLGMMSYGATKLAKGAVDGATFIARPKAWYNTAKGMGDLATNKKVQVGSDQVHGHVESQQPGTRGLALHSIQSDPAGFLFEMTGGIIGGHFAEKGLQMGWNRITGTKLVKETQLQTVTIKDVDHIENVQVPGSTYQVSQRSVKTQVTPGISSKVRRVPTSVMDDANVLDDIIGKPAAPDLAYQGVNQADTIIGDAGGVGVKVRLGTKQVDDLYQGKTVVVDDVTSQLVPVPDEYVPVAGIDVTTDPITGKTASKYYKTSGQEMFKEMGMDTPFDNTPPRTRVTAPDEVRVNVRGMGKYEDVEVPTTPFKKPDPGPTAPWISDRELFNKARVNADDYAQNVENFMRNTMKAPGKGEAPKVGLRVKTGYVKNVGGSTRVRPYDPTSGAGAATGAASKFPTAQGPPSTRRPGWDGYRDSGRGGGSVPGSSEFSRNQMRERTRGTRQNPMDTARNDMEIISGLYQDGKIRIDSGTRNTEGTGTKDTPVVGEIPIPMPGPTPIPTPTRTKQKQVPDQAVQEIVNLPQPGRPRIPGFMPSFTRGPPKVWIEGTGPGRKKIRRGKMPWMLEEGRLHGVKDIDKLLKEMSK